MSIENDSFDDFNSPSTYFNDLLMQSLEDRFNSIKESGQLFNNSFNDNVWVIYDDFKKENIYVRFSLNKELLRYPEIVKYIKSWTLLLIEDLYNYSYIRQKVHRVIKAINASHYFDIKYIGNFKSICLKDSYSQKHRVSIARHILQFLDYATDFEIHDDYYQILIETSQLNNSFFMNRVLPGSKDILKFSLVVENYFNTELDHMYYLKYFPIYLWWNLTNIIPLRIIEFCNIKYDCLSESDEGYFITLPRRKTQKQRDVRFDKILISTSLANDIIKYQEYYSQFGASETLIFYRPFLYDSEYESINFKSNTENGRFTYRIFYILLNDFYEKIVSKKYGFTIKEDSLLPIDDLSNKKLINRKVRPNDTRHFAFLNLMLQGYHPSEIARIGGHSTITAQTAYYNHLEYWVDSDLISLLTTQKGNLQDLSNNFFSNIIFKQKIQSPAEKSDTKIPLKIGYCTDPLQNCPVDDHFLCEHWRLTFEDYKKHFDEIQKRVDEQQSVLSLMVNKLLDLQKTGMANYKNDLFSETNSDFNYKLIEQSKSVKDALYKLLQLKGRLNIYEKSRTQTNSLF